MPYNFLLDLKQGSTEASWAFKVDLENCIIIIDEAHNIKDFAESASNFQLT